MILPRSVSDWPEEYRELFHERAGIMEYQGNMTKAIAEERAEIDVRKAAWSEMT